MSDPKGGPPSIPRRIILSRPDNLGDAVVTLSMAGWIKHFAPDTHITALTRAYTRPVWERCAHVNEVITLEELQASERSAAIARFRAVKAEAIVHVFPHREVARWAKAAGIPRRIGTSHRWWHWCTCNERVAFSRKRSDLHEAQLNIELLAPFGVPVPAEVRTLIPFTGLVKPKVPPDVRTLLDPSRRNVIVHPLKGSGVEWGLSNFAELIRLLDPSRYHCLITGTQAEAERYRAVLPMDAPNVTDTGGTLPLDRLMDLIGASDALVAASTGPLHIAAASGIRAIGLFSTRRPIHPGRWAPLGPDVHVLVNDIGAPPQEPDPITAITPQRVVALLEELPARRT